MEIDGKTVFHKRLRDFESFDEIRLKVVPRYKTSGLSGDEWRTGVLIEFMFKGQVIEEDFVIILIISPLCKFLSDFSNSSILQTYLKLNGVSKI